MSGRTARTGACTAADARTRLRQAQLHLGAAELVRSEQLSEAATVATPRRGGAVLATPLAEVVRRRIPPPPFTSSKA
ncbi:hypothetical protein [Kineococcus auxinigenes]|uniref:hypothetical protein n=1 Tax=unclassified Kineococcus TaxID=2621656 RepID=UPI003D7EDCBD